MDPLLGSPWSDPATVASFVRARPNAALQQFAKDERERSACLRVLDIGCGAGRNAIPLARLGWDVIGVDLSLAMLESAIARARTEPTAGRLRVALALMDALPVKDGSIDLLVAHGIWNLARSSVEFRRAVTEAARAARPGAGLFVFTFSRSTFPAAVEPITGETYVFTQFSGGPQCFLTGEQLVSELGAAGFVREPAIQLVEHNRREPGALLMPSVPVIYEGVFRRAS